MNQQGFMAASTPATKIIVWIICWESSYTMAGVLLHNFYVMMPAIIIPEILCM